MATNATNPITSCTTELTGVVNGLISDITAHASPAAQASHPNEAAAIVSSLRALIASVTTTRGGIEHPLSSMSADSRKTGGVAADSSMSADGRPSGVATDSSMSADGRHR